MLYKKMITIKATTKLIKVIDNLTSLGLIFILLILAFIRFFLYNKSRLFFYNKYLFFFYIKLGKKRKILDKTLDNLVCLCK